MQEIKGYLKKLDLKTGIVGFGGIFLIILWAYQGHSSFFLLHFPALREKESAELLKILWLHCSAFFLWFLIPLLLIWLVLKENPRNFGSY